MKRVCASRMAALTLVAIVAVSSSQAFAQATFGNISGTVTDPTGAAIPNAQVTITSLDRGETFQTRTNDSGNYSQTHLLAGSYKMVIAASGFSDFDTTVIVQVDATTRSDAQLQVGKASTEVVVTAEAPLLKSDRAEVSTTITGPELQKLPILDRNITSLLVSMPGAGRYAYGAGVASAENQQADQGTPMNGQLPYSNGFNLDGTENHSNILGLAVVNPNPDALEEFKVTSSNYDAEFGNVSGAMLQGTTKSGTNQYHGSLFEYLRNDKFNAADPFTGINAPIRWNQFGGSLGGPIIKDKLFVFFAYQGSRKHISGAEIVTVPTAAERSGDLSALLGSYICADGTTSGTPCSNPVMVPTTEGQHAPAQSGMVFDPTTGNPDGSGREASLPAGE